MEIIRVTSTWDAAADVYTLYSDPNPPMFAPEPVPGLAGAFLLMELDEHERETGRVIGAEIIGFSECTDWGKLPRLDLAWQLDGGEPVSLSVLLEREQSRLRESAGRSVRASR